MSSTSLPALLSLMLLQTNPPSPGTPPPAGQEPPAEPRGLVTNVAGAFDGYTLFSPLSSKSIVLIGMDGELVHRWETGSFPTGAVYLLASGDLLRCARAEKNPRFEGGGMGGRIEELDWDGQVVWEYVLADDYQTQHHDIHPLPNGNVLVIAWEHRYLEDAVEYGRDPAKIGDRGMWPDALLEIRPTRPQGGEIVWEWHIWDHLTQDFDPQKANHGAVADRPELLDINYDHRNEPPVTPEELARRAKLAEEMQALGYSGGAEDSGDAGGTAKPATAQPARLPDWLHANGFDYLPEQDLILLSSPELCEFLVIDHSTTGDQAAGHSGGKRGKGGDILYRWGNPRNYGCGTKADQKLFYQHNPTWLPGAKPGELRVLVFNNGQGRPGKEFSSVEELVLPFDPKSGFAREKGQAFGPATSAWSYSDPEKFFSSFISGAQRLPNGNTLICSGAQGRVFEVTPEGRVVWDYENTYGGEGGPPGPPVPIGGATPGAGPPANAGAPALIVGGAPGGPGAPGAVGSGPGGPGAGGPPPGGGGAPLHALFRATRIPKDHPGLRGKSLP